MAALTTVKIAQLVKSNKWKQGWRKATGQQMVNRGLCSSITYRWLTSSGRTQNSRAKCIIYEKHLYSKWSHLWALPLQMLLNCIKERVTHVEATTARGLQCGLFTIHKSALLFTSGGRLGKNLIWVSDEQIALLSSKISLEVSNETIFLWRFQPSSAHPTQ